MLCNLTIQSWTGENFNPRSMSVRRVLRQGALMSTMKNIPYSRFMLREASECPICLKTFESGDQVAQLKCNKYHIFHSDCLRAYLDVPGPPKKCPLCREEVRIQDPPILE